MACLVERSKTWENPSLYVLLVTEFRCAISKRSHKKKQLNVTISSFEELWRST